MPHSGVSPPHMSHWNLILRGRLHTGHESWQHVRSELALCRGPTAGKAGSAACGKNQPVQAVSSGNVQRNTC